MDRSTDEAYAWLQHGSSAGGPREARRSYEQTPPRLQKKRSVRSTGPTRSHPIIDTPPATRASVSGAGDPAAGLPRTRKSSLRQAVRKIFGRRSRDVDVQTARSSPPRHTYHNSEPLPPQPELPDLFAQPQIARLTQRSMPDPLRSSPPMLEPPLRITSPMLEPPLRIASPTAGAFPNSFKLKPLDLGNPQIRRRKTLPNVKATVLEDATLSSSPLVAPPIPRVSGLVQDAEAVKRAKSIKDAKRRSRSAGDLRKSAALTPSPPRNRNEEIKFWRESFQPDVLRASGFLSRPLQFDNTLMVQEEDRTPLATTGINPFPGMSSSRPGTAGDSPLHARGDLDQQSASGNGTDMSRDLEDRIAKLETGLRTFQRSLQRLTAERNRKTVIVGGEPSMLSRSPSDTRTPSMLADTLQGPYRPSTYEFDFGCATTSPPSSPPLPVPQRPPPPAPRQRLEDPFGPELPTVMATPTARPNEALRMDDPPEAYRPPPIPGLNESTAQAPEYTFRSLYQMLNDERSARRRLEAQMRSLRQEISDLSSQVAYSSNMQSQRSSYIPLDLAAGSSRLRELLRDTESSPPGSAHRPYDRAGAGDNTLRASDLSSVSAPASTSAAPGPVMSRFSQSESEAGYEELETPLEAYRTPISRSSSFYNHPSGRDEAARGSSEMF